MLVAVSGALWRDFEKEYRSRQAAADTIVSSLPATYVRHVYPTWAKKWGSNSIFSQHYRNNSEKSSPVNLFSRK